MSHTVARQGRASHAERISMRREAVALVVERRPGLTASEIGEELTETGAWGCVLNDLKLMETAGKVQRVRVTTRTHIWFRHPPADMPLVWEGDQG